MLKSKVEFEAASKNAKNSKIGFNQADTKAIVDNGENEFIEASKESWNTTLDNLQKSFQDLHTVIKDSEPFTIMKESIQDFSAMLDELSDKIANINIFGGQNNVKNGTAPQSPETKASGGLAQQGDVVGGGEFVMTRAATKNWGTDILNSLNNFQMPALPKMPELTELKNGSQFSGNNYIVELHLPNEKTYQMKTTEETFKELAMEYHFRGPSQSSTTFSEFLEKKFGW
ncbi:MAG: hypothetical protein HQK91_05740 [Nitrospirae bacterium]|nr:hypothetical protein [Nitrospirota bacterium]